MARVADECVNWGGVEEASAGGSVEDMQALWEGVLDVGVTWR